ncbi:ThuA domain-containing protein [Sphingobacterium faecium]|uniref:ThuA domain-containing protein n=1 Tax=Sphingobacterium faecium TaxID=34087 RepID=UPI002468F737|nr:ThuA domain-containing protein [Sphingobacterium faecium]MDH5827000.1 ThuA domain-containing protein [Sphingobacterium faecium]
MKYKSVMLLLAIVVSSIGSLCAKTMAPSFDNQQKKKNVLVVGGGGSHDFDRWYKIEDTKLINTMADVNAIYTDNTDSIRFYLKTTDLLVLTNNQPISKASQVAIEKFVAQGKPLILLHAAVWYNWEDWSKYNLEYVGGGSKSHENFQEFKNIVVNTAHPINQGVSPEFTFKDELYRHEPDATGKGIDVLVIGQSLETAKVYPAVFTVNHAKSRIVGITLGHDEHSHLNKDYRKILINAIHWALNI